MVDDVRLDPFLIYSNAHAVLKLPVVPMTVCVLQDASLASNSSTDSGRELLSPRTAAAAAAASAAFDALERPPPPPPCTCFIFLPTPNGTALRKIPLHFSEDCTAAALMACLIQQTGHVESQNTKEIGRIAGQLQLCVADTTGTRDEDCPGIVRAYSLQCVQQI